MIIIMIGKQAGRRAGRQKSKVSIKPITIYPLKIHSTKWKVFHHKQTTMNQVRVK